MKRIFLITSVAALTLLACNSSDKSGSTGAAGDKKSESSLSDNPDYQKGLEIVSKNDCLTCHRVDEKIQGPTYRDVANKYAGYPDTIVTHLANKIIQGGSGVWGEIPMIPHPSLTQEEAEAAVKYVLLLKNK